MATLNSAQDLMVWADLETTDLNPDYGAILEIGMIVTDWLGKPLGQKSSLVIDPRLSRALSAMPKVVEEMHTKSGLLDEVLDLTRLNGAGGGKYHPEVVEKSFTDWLETTFRLHPGSSPMCGSTISFDRRWLEEHMSKLHDWFHYRNVDITTLKNMIRNLNPRVAEALPEKREMHRVISDLEDTIRDYNFYLDNFVIVGLTEEDERRIEAVRRHHVPTE